MYMKTEKRKMLSTVAQNNVTSWSDLPGGGFELL